MNLYNRKGRIRAGGNYCLTAHTEYFDCYFPKTNPRHGNIWIIVVPFAANVNNLLNMNKK